MQQEKECGGVVVFFAMNFFAEAKAKYTWGGKNKISLVLQYKTSRLVTEYTSETNATQSFRSYNSINKNNKK